MLIISQQTKVRFVLVRCDDVDNDREEREEDGKMYISVLSFLFDRTIEDLHARSYPST